MGKGSHFSLCPTYYGLNSGRRNSDKWCAHVKEDGLPFPKLSLMQLKIELNLETKVTENIYLLSHHQVHGSSTDSQKKVEMSVVVPALADRSITV